MATERRYTARIHRIDGSIELLSVDTRGGEPVEEIEVAGRMNPDELVLHIYQVRFGHNPSADVIDYDLAREVVTVDVPEGASGADIQAAEDAAIDRLTEEERRGEHGNSE